MDLIVATGLGAEAADLGSRKVDPSPKDLCVSRFL